MSTETTTVDLTTLQRAAARLVESAHARKTHRGRRRHPHADDRLAVAGVLIGVTLLAVLGAVLAWMW